MAIPRTRISDHFAKLDTGSSAKKNISRKRPRIEAEYERLIINQITIQLPPGLTPYPSQKMMMIRLIQALKSRKHAMIESPTGSGKTMGLLSACCAWLDDYKIKRREARRQCPQHGDGSVAEGFLQAAKNAKISKNDTSVSSNLTTDNDESLFLRNALDDEDFEDIQRAVYNPFNDNPDETIYDNSEHLPEAECTCSEFKKIRIYYGTRTHKQISQVIKEFDRLPYGHANNEKQLRHTILASREQSCVNADVRQSPDMATSCKELIAPEGIGCIFRNNLRSFEDPNKLRKKIDQNGGGVWDVEDLKSALTTLEACPYFASTRTLTSDSDIIFTPFNYLLDPIIRNSSDVILKNSIVILDEAHNVEDTCRDAVSFTFKESEINLALTNFNDKLSECKNSAFLTGMKKGGSDSSAEIKAFEESMTRLGKLAKKIELFVYELAKLVPSSPGQYDRCSKTWDCKEFFLLLQNEQDSEKNLYITGVELERYLKDFTVITAPRKDDAASVLEDIRLSAVAIVLVEKYLYFMTYFSKPENQMLYKCNIAFHPVEQNGPTQSRQLSKKPKGRKDVVVYDNDGFIEGIQPSKSMIRPGFEAVLNFWCMSPSIACMEAFKECYSVILASGTLCPTETLKTELGIEFGFEMEGSQVIPDKNIFASVVSKGPKNINLVCTYKNMQESAFYVELLRIIRDICKTVPKGVLVFVSSYRILKELQRYMGCENIQSDIEKHKRIFYEPNRSRELKDVLEDFTYSIENSSNDVNEMNGALMLAVFRGKVSEGIDFTDDMARCVICIGIPFPSATDELVLQKKRFNDYCIRENGKNMLTGDQWYSTQAYRALNQALGRCLRHRNDWGAIILLDHRFIEKANPKNPDSKKISRWVRHRLVQFPDHAAFLKSLSHFVQERLNDADHKPVKKEQLVVDLDDDDERENTTPDRSSIFSKRSSNKSKTSSDVVFGI